MPIKRKSEETTAITPISPRSHSLAAMQPELIPGYGNITHEDLVVPRLKLVQGMSPEAKRENGGHPQGHWFHTSEGKTLGEELVVVSLGIKKTVELWPPRGSKEEGQGIMARSSDGVHWDEGYANREFTIEYEDGYREIWKTKADVKASGMCDFRAGAAPIAGYTYRLALYLPSLPEYPASLYIVSRTATQGVLDLNGKINNRRLAGTPFWCQRYKMWAQLRKGKGNISWYVPAFESMEAIKDPDLAETLRIRAESIYRSNVVSHDEEERLQGGEDKGRRDTYQGRDRSRGSNY
jgi:hypothetical protein